MLCIFLYMTSNLANIIQYGTDGFGHQLEGTLRLISSALNGKANYIYGFIKTYQFEHSNYNFDDLKGYMICAMNILMKITNARPVNEYKSFIKVNNRSLHDLPKNDDTLYLLDGVGCGAFLPAYVEPTIEFKNTIDHLRRAFVSENNYLPRPSYYRLGKFERDTGASVHDGNINDNVEPKDPHTVCVHIRLNDAVNTRPLETEKIFRVVKYYQNNYPDYNIVIHSDGDVSQLANKNTIIHDVNTDVLQILSDFIHADTLIINYSSLSIAAHILAKDDQIVYCPGIAGVTFKHRILPKCVPFDILLQS